MWRRTVEHHANVPIETQDFKEMSPAMCVAMRIAWNLDRSREPYSRLTMLRENLLYVRLMLGTQITGFPIVPARVLGEHLIDTHGRVWDLGLQHAEIGSTLRGKVRVIEIGDYQDKYIFWDCNATGLTLGFHDWGPCAEGLHAESLRMLDPWL